MENMLEKVKACLEKIAMQVVTLEPGNIPAMGEILNTLTALEESGKAFEDSTFLNVITGYKGYLEKLILDEKSDLSPLEDGVAVLQDICRALENNEKYGSDTADLLRRLGVFPDRGETEGCQKNDPAEPENDQTKKKSETLSQEDIQILEDFVVESSENLESIEVHLIDLEQEPENKETINAIFRPFHTIKGVSGFLNLSRINRLSHCTENMLDSVRRGEFQINNTIIDVILEAVDTLKQMIRTVEKSLAAGEADLEGEIDIDPLIKKIEESGRSAQGDGRRLGEILVERGAIKEEDLQKVLKKQDEAPGKKIGEILIDEKKTQSKEVISALRDQKQAKRLSDLQVKVDTDKLDNLIDLTGELVISQAMLRQNPMIRSINNQQVYQNLAQLAQIVSGLQKITMSMRMVPIKSTFQKMFRLVRDLAKNSGKEVGLEMDGEDTEIDRNVVDELYEPLVHMIRNAVDHGIESPEEREKEGKARNGTIYLRAYHKGGNFVIEIEDDGKGLDKERIIQKAIATNLIARDENLSESQIFNLIFHPGFSTAQKVTDVSGRGVGMDVVKKKIEKLRGRLDLHSTPGRGTTVVISLPLTLAIIEGMIVRAGIERYIIPTMAVVESFQPKKEDCSTVRGKGEMVMVRGNLLPLIRFDEIFGVKTDSKNPWEGLVVVVENKQEKKGLLLDDLLGQEEVVIKSLGEALRGIKGLAGGAILGDGRVGLILDVAGLFEISMNAV